MRYGGGGEFGDTCMSGGLFWEDEDGVQGRSRGRRCGGWVLEMSSRGRDGQSERAWVVGLVLLHRSLAIALVTGAAVGLPNDAHPMLILRALQQPPDTQHETCSFPPASTSPCPRDGIRTTPLLGTMVQIERPPAT